MKEIQYNNKTIKIPAYFANNIDPKQALNMTTCTNPYSNESCELPDFAATIYIILKMQSGQSNTRLCNKVLLGFRNTLLSNTLYC